MRARFWPVVCVLLLVWAPSAEGQSKEGQSNGVGIDVGIRAGVTSSQLWGSGVQSVSRRTGGVLGLFLRADIAGPLSVQTELLYVQKGAQFVTTSGSVSPGAEEDIRWDAPLNYVEVPLLLRADLAQLRSGSLMTVLAAGPTVSYLSVPIGGFPPDEPRYLQAGLLVGPSLTVDLGATDLSTSVRYRIGLTSVYDGAEPIRNRGIAATIGIAF